MKMRNHTILPDRAGEHLKELIYINYPSQESFAEAFECDRRTVGRWIKNGIHNLDLIEELASFFKIDPLFFLSENVSKTEKVVTTHAKNEAG